MTLLPDELALAGDGIAYASTIILLDGKVLLGFGTTRINGKENYPRIPYGRHLVVGVTLEKHSASVLFGKQKKKLHSR